ncbi:MAG: tryptophan 2,3-dioxygenase [Planctomycetota bacterium]|jgi:tryptophan 2,3-dioxygenase
MTDNGARAALTYARYLKLDELLALQEPRSEGPEHDEMLFIIIHQVYELWFKEVCHELDLLQTSLESNRHPLAAATLKRVLTILKTLVGQIDILETMTPVSFVSFRDRLESASGFQSAQFREFEFVCGNKSRKMLAHHRDAPAVHERLERRFGERSLYDSFLRYLAANGYEVPQEALNRDLTAPPQEWPKVQRILTDVYRTDPETRQICELLVDFDEGLQEWRYRHVKMVERTIGTRTGTGGSAGAEYLRSTLFRPLFPDLWAIRAGL